MQKSPEAPHSKLLAVSSDAFTTPKGTPLQVHTIHPLRPPETEAKAKALVGIVSSRSDVVPDDRPETLRSSPESPPSAQTRPPGILPPPVPQKLLPSPTKPMPPSIAVPQLSEPSAAVPSSSTHAASSLNTGSSGPPLPPYMPSLWEIQGLYCLVANLRQWLEDLGDSLSLYQEELPASIRDPIGLLIQLQEALPPCPELPSSPGAGVLSSGVFPAGLFSAGLSDLDTLPASWQALVVAQAPPPHGMSPCPSGAQEDRGPSVVPIQPRTTPISVDGGMVVGTEEVVEENDFYDGGDPLHGEGGVGPISHHGGDHRHAGRGGLQGVRGGGSAAGRVVSKKVAKLRKSLGLSH